MVDRRGIEPLPEACKATVLPLSLPAQILASRQRLELRPRVLETHVLPLHQRDNQLLTVSLFEGTINTATFNSWIEHDLLPKLPKRSVVIMDNAAFHKDKTMQDQLMKLE